MRSYRNWPADLVVADNSVGKTDLVDSVCKTDLVVADNSVGKTDLVVAEAEEHHP